MRLLSILLAAAAGIISFLHGSPGTAEASCDAHYLNGTEPTIPERFEARTKELCYDSFALLHSGLTRSALWSAERLTPESIAAARRVERTGQFFPEPQVLPSDRSELEDYRGSGFDRGHLAPSGNMPTTTSQHESFTLANIVPQAPTLNRNAWANLERNVRDAVQSQGTAYVVTGPLYLGNELQSLRSRVLVPTHIWKAIHIPNRGTNVYIAKNTDDSGIAHMSVDLFTKTYGIDPFPALSDDGK